MWPRRFVRCYDIVISFCLVYFNCIVQAASQYRSVDIGNMWHGALVSCTPSQSVRLVLGVGCSGIQCHCVFPLLIRR